MRELSPEFKAYTWAMPTDEVARLAGIDPTQVIRFDQNTPPLPLPSTRPGTIAGALAGISGYPAGGYRALRQAIADYNSVAPENVVLGVGADDRAAPALPTPAPKPPRGWVRRCVMVPQNRPPKLALANVC